jgi:hypothetical protein
MSNRKKNSSYQSLLLYCNSRWLSGGETVADVYSVRGAAPLYLEEQDLLHAEHFCSEYFVSKLAYLSNIF